MLLTVAFLKTCSTSPLRAVLCWFYTHTHCSKVDTSKIRTCRHRPGCLQIQIWHTLLAGHKWLFLYSAFEISVKQSVLRFLQVGLCSIYIIWPLEGAPPPPIIALSLGYAVCKTELVTLVSKYTVLTHCPTCTRRVYIYFTEHRAVVSCEYRGTNLFKGDMS